jgi:SAM-dependent methyltransferase
MSLRWRGHRNRVPIRSIGGISQMALPAAAMPDKYPMTNDAPTSERIMQFAWGYAPTLILEVAITHKVFDYLDETGHTAREVATYAHGSERGWRAILNALVGFQFLAREGDRYRTTPESSAFLVSTKPAFIGGLFRHISRHLLPAWMHLPEIVQTGKPAIRVNNAREGEKFFEEFVSDLFPLSHPPAKILGEHLGLAQASGEVRVLDIAAGSGVWGIALAQQSPRVKVTAVDWPGVLPVTRKHVAGFGLEAQFSYLSGDLLAMAFPAGQDIATLGHIFHSEGEIRSRQLLKKLHAAIKPGGTIAIAEFTPNAERTGPPQSLIFAVNMLVNTEEGDTYPFEEVAGWLKDAGFDHARELPAPGPAPLILATRV